MRTDKLATHRDTIQGIVALSGLLAALLYVAGYLAERVHWNLYGHIEVPPNHIQFLYRGGNIVISGLASLPLFVMLSPLRAVFVFVTILLLVVAVSCHSLPLRAREAVHIHSDRPFWIACFVLLLILLLYELVEVPEVPRNILFETGRLDASQWADYFRSYVTVTISWLAFCAAAYRSQRRRELDNDTPDATTMTEGQEGHFVRIDHKTQKWTLFFVGERTWGVGGGADEVKDAELVTKRRALSAGPTQLMFTASVVVTVALFAYLPIVYGIFQFPNVYPIVDVGLTKDVAPDMAARVGTSPKALLFETVDEYVLYRTHDTPSILKLRRSEVSAITILKECDVTKPEAFVANSPCVEN